MFNFEEKTGISQASLASLITSFVIGLAPFTGLTVTESQAVNAGLAIAAAAVFVARLAYKRKANKNG